MWVIASRAMRSRAASGWVEMYKWTIDVMSESWVEAKSLVSHQKERSAVHMLKDPICVEKIARKRKGDRNVEVIWEEGPYYLCLLSVCCQRRPWQMHSPIEERDSLQMIVEALPCISMYLCLLIWEYTIKRFCYYQQIYRYRGKALDRSDWP